MTAKAKFADELKMIYSTNWPVSPDKRSLILCIENAGKIKVRRISDKVAG